MARADSQEKTLMLRKVEGRRRREWWKMRWLDGIITWWTWVWASSGRCGEQGSLVCGVHRVTKSGTQLSDWTTTIDKDKIYLNLYKIQLDQSGFSEYSKIMLRLGPIYERWLWGLGFCGLCCRTESVSEIPVTGTMLGGELVLNKYSSIKCLVLLVLF